jgi:hypothetical protein
MNRWRIIVVAAIVVATLVMIASTLFFDQPLLRRPWVAPKMVKSEYWSRRLSMSQDESVLVDLASLLAILVSQFLVGVLTLYTVPDRVKHIARVLAFGGGQLLRYLAIGALMAITMAAVGVLSILTIHTFPLPFILVVIFFLAALIGTVALAYQLGRSLMYKAGLSRESPLVSLALGTLLIFGVTRVPFLGGIALIIVWLLGAGVAIYTHFGSGKTWSLKPLLEEKQV